jgi:hypothetical protein
MFEPGPLLGGDPEFPNPFRGAIRSGAAEPVPIRRPRLSGISIRIRPFIPPFAIPPAFISEIRLRIVTNSQSEYFFCL